MWQNEVVIASARRSAIGAFNGRLSSLEAHALGAAVITAALHDAAVDAEQVDEVILGQVLSAGAGMNPARQAARGAGLPDAVTAFSVNQVCGSGLRAVALGAQQILCGDAAVIVAGGQESMSLAPHVTRIRQGKKFGDVGLIDTLSRDGLSDAFSGHSMAMTAENIARHYHISREQQDAYALQSQQRASRAQKAGKFDDEIVPIPLSARGQTECVDQDEFIRHDADLEKMSALHAIIADGGTVTAANASGINDGAAALVLMSGNLARAEGLHPLGRVLAWASTGLDPEMMGMGPVAATRHALHKAGWSREDVDLWEVNEAFAVQALAVIRELGLDPERVNVNGGAIALGHPIGASGARVLVTLLHEMQRRQVRRGVATLCIGGGMGIALCVER